MENKLINFKVIRIISLALQLFNCFLLMLLVWKYCTSWGFFVCFLDNFLFSTKFETLHISGVFFGRGFLSFLGRYVSALWAVKSRNAAYVCQRCVSVCVAFQSVLEEVCELRFTVGECEESAAIRRPLLFTDIAEKPVLLCFCVTSWSESYLE